MGRDRAQQLRIGRLSRGEDIVAITDAMKRAEEMCNCMQCLKQWPDQSIDNEGGDGVKGKREGPSFSDCAKALIGRKIDLALAHRIESLSVSSESYQIPRWMGSIRSWRSR